MAKLIQCFRFKNKIKLKKKKKRNIFQAGKRNNVQNHRSREQHGEQRDSGQIRHHWSPEDTVECVRGEKCTGWLESPVAFYDRVRNMGTF